MSRPWMPLYVDDYLGDTLELSTLEHGAYLLLIMQYWKKGGLPNDDEKLARIARLSPEQWSSIRSSIASYFDDGWKHSRIDDEIAKSDEKYQKRVAAGRKGGKSRKSEQCESNAQAHAQANAIASRNQPQPHSSNEEAEAIASVVPAEPSEIDQAFTAWNDLATELDHPRCQKVSKARRSKMAARLKDCGGIEGWRTALAKVRDSPFLRGANERGWRADIDFLLQDRSFTRLMEGRYDNRPGKAAANPSGSRSGFDAFVAAAGKSLARSEGTPGDGWEFSADGQDGPPASGFEQGGHRGLRGCLAPDH